MQFAPLRCAQAAAQHVEAIALLRRREEDEAPQQAPQQQTAALDEAEAAEPATKSVKIEKE